MKIFQKTLIIFIFLISLFTVNVAYAGVHTGPIVPCTDNCNLCHFWQLGSNIINFISFNLAIPIAVLLFVVAGIIFIVSGGDENRITLAKKIFTNVVFGLIIIMSSWLLIDTLFKTIADGNLIGAWSSFPLCN